MHICIFGYRMVYRHGFGSVFTRGKYSRHTAVREVHFPVGTILSTCVCDLWQKAMVPKVAVFHVRAAASSESCFLNKTKDSEGKLLWVSTGLPPALLFLICCSELIRSDYFQESFIDVRSRRPTTARRCFRCLASTSGFVFSTYDK